MSPKNLREIYYPELDISHYLSNFSKEVSQLTDWQTYKQFSIIGKWCKNIQGMSPKNFRKISPPGQEISLYYIFRDYRYGNFYPAVVQISGQIFPYYTGNFRPYISILYRKFFAIHIILADTLIAHLSALTSSSPCSLVMIAIVKSTYSKQIDWKKSFKSNKKFHDSFVAWGCWSCDFWNYFNSIIQESWDWHSKTTAYERNYHLIIM